MVPRGATSKAAPRGWEQQGSDAISVRTVERIAFIEKIRTHLGLSPAPTHTPRHQPSKSCLTSHKGTQ